MTRKLIILLVVLFSAINTYSQVVSLKVTATASGARDGIHYRYKFGSYARDTSDVFINLNDSVVTAGDKQYMIVTTPEHWHIHRTYKWCTFMCCDNNYRKVFVKLFRYDNSNRSRIHIYEMDSATRYWGKE